MWPINDNKHNFIFQFIQLKRIKCDEGLLTNHSYRRECYDSCYVYITQNIMLYRDVLS